MFIKKESTFIIFLIFEYLMVKVHSSTIQELQEKLDKIFINQLNGNKFTIKIRGEFFRIEHEFQCEPNPNNTSKNRCEAKRIVTNLGSFSCYIHFCTNTLIIIFQKTNTVNKHINLNECLKNLFMFDAILVDAKKLKVFHLLFCTTRETQIIFNNTEDTLNTPLLSIVLKNLETELANPFDYTLQGIVLEVDLKTTDGILSINYNIIKL